MNDPERRPALATAPLAAWLMTSLRRHFTRMSRARPARPGSRDYRASTLWVEPGSGRARDDGPAAEEVLEEIDRVHEVHHAVSFTSAASSGSGAAPR